MNESNGATLIDGVVDGYFAMWNETDPTRRREVIEATWTPDASYVDPMFDAEGPDALDSMVAGVHERFLGHRFRPTGPSISTTTAHGGAGNLSDLTMARPSLPASTSPYSHPTAGCARSPASSSS